jgi:hypothetical protein
MSTFARSASIVVLAMVVVACGGAASSSSPGASAAASGPPTQAASASPAASPSLSARPVGAIDHPTGATDVVLRFEEGGGFVMPAYLASQAPIFTLYGDGTIIFRNPAAEPLPAVGSVYPFGPFRTAVLTEDQVQDLLKRALQDAGLAAARAEYLDQMVADASTATFTVNAGGLKKTVSVYALGMEQPGMADLLSRQAFAKFAETLKGLDTANAFETTVYVPERYRGILMEGQPGDPAAKPWPWKDVKPTDFVAAQDPNSLQLPVRHMTVAQVEAVGIKPYGGGFQGLTLIGPGDGKVYTFALRPLLPDDPA